MSMPGDITVINTISIQGSGPAPIVRSNEALGGAQNATTLVARDAIPAYLRQEGMYVYVIATTQTYQLVGGILNANWVLASGAATLQTAYDGGNTILLAGALPVAITNPAASATAVMTLSQGTAGQNALTATGGDINTTGNFVTLSTTLADGSLSRTGALTVQATGAAVDLTLNARGAGTDLNQAGQVSLNVAYTGVGRTSLIGAINALVDGTVTPTASALSAVLAIGNTTGANNILVSAGQRIDTAPAGTLNLGTVGATAGVNIGSTGNPIGLPGNVTIGGDLTVNGTVTTINSTNTTIADQILLIASTTAVQVFSAYTIERGASGDDLLFLWNPTNNRTEVGFFDTVGGTVAPASALTTLSDLRANNLTLAGTSVTADAALTVAATGAGNDLTFTGRASSITFNQAGETVLDVAFTGAGRTSIVGALNALVDGTVPAATTLQTAYNGGSSIVNSLANGAVSITNSVAAGTDALQVSKTPGAAQAGSGVNVTMGANATGVGANISHAGSGNGLTVTITGSGLAGLFSGGTISCPDAGANSERFGNGATAAGVNSVALGNSASAAFANTVVIGFSASVTSTSSVSIGRGATADTSAVAVGFGASATGTDSIAIGANASATTDGTAIGQGTTASTQGEAIGVGATNAGFSSSIALGYVATNTAVNQLVIGGNAAAITTVVIGNDVTNAAPTSLTITGTGSSSALAGAAVTLRAGNNTGTGAGGALNLLGGLGAAGATGTGGAVNLAGGAGGTADGVGGAVSVSGGTGQGIGAGGLTTVAGGPASGSGAGGVLNLNGGTSATGLGGSVVIQTGNAALATRVTVQRDGFTRFGTGTATSTVHINGSLAMKTTSIAGATAADATTTVYLCDASGAAFALTLPLASTCTDRTYTIKKTDTSGNIVTITASGADLIDGQATQPVSFPYEAIGVVSDGTNWWIV